MGFYQHMRGLLQYQMYSMALYETLLEHMPEKYREWWNSVGKRESEKGVRGEREIKGERGSD